MYLCTQICILFHLSVRAVFLIYRFMLDQINFQTTLDVVDALNRTLILLETSCRPPSQERHVFTGVSFAHSEISRLLNHFENCLTAICFLTSFIGKGLEADVLLFFPVLVYSRGSVFGILFWDVFWKSSDNIVTLWVLQILNLCKSDLHKSCEN